MSKVIVSRPNNKAWVAASFKDRFYSSKAILEYLDYTFHSSFQAVWYPTKKELTKLFLRQILNNRNFSFIFKTR